LVDLNLLDISNLNLTRMWANAQRDGRPAEYRCMAPCVQSRKVWLTPTTRVPCMTLPMRNPLKFAGVSQTPEQISAASGPKFAILWDIWRHMEEVLAV